MTNDDRPFGSRMPEANAAANSIRAKVQRAAKRGTGCRLTAEEAWTLDFMEGDGEWWNADAPNLSSDHPLLRGGE